jgi:ABC-type glycerol-3-phosphate transport system permease component
MYAAAQQTGLHDTHLGLVLVFAAWRLPILVWLLRAYMEAVPKEVEEAAFLDGCNRLSVLFRIVAPLIAPGLISSFLITFVYVWNDFIFGITMTITPEMRTVQVGLYQFMGDMGIRWAPFMAYTILSTLPVLLLFILLQKRFVEGLTAGAAKG